MRQIRLLTGVTCLLLSLVGCAYFNTYYNASLAYDTARKEHRKLTATSRDTVPALPSRGLAGYDSAISKSLKVLQLYPRDIRRHDDAVFLIGRSLFYKKEYQRAQRRFRQLIDEFPASPFVPEAWLYLGKAYLEDDNLAKAEETFSLILSRYPHLDRDKEVSILLAELAIRRQGKALAIELLEKALTTTRDEKGRMELHLRIAGLYIDLKRYDRAEALLAAAPRKRGESGLLYRIDDLLLTCHIERQQFERALKLAEEMSRNSTYYRHISRILLRKASILDGMKHFDEAITAYELVVNRYAGSAQAGDAWFALGVIYQKVKGDYEKAEECYEKAAQLLSDQDFKLLAGQRREALALLRTLRNRSSDSLAAPGDTGVGFDRYRIGEIFWLRLDEPDSAMAYFSAIASDTATLPDSAAMALYAAGWIAYTALKDTVSADSILGVLQKRFPQTVYARRSQELQGRPITILTREDSAQAALLRAEDRLFDQSDPSVAIDEYLRVYRTYADQPQGSQALFAAAWLNDRILEKNKSAFALYQEVCDSFPESRFCTEGAEPRLRVVRDTLRVRKATRSSAAVEGPPPSPRPGRRGYTRPSQEMKSPSEMGAEAGDRAGVNETLEETSPPEFRSLQPDQGDQQDTEPEPDQTPSPSADGPP